MSADPLGEWSNAAVYATVGLVMAAALCTALGFHLTALTCGVAALVVVLATVSG